MAGLFRLGLTGGIGSGKSTVAKFFASQGATVIDADAISRSVTAPQGAAIEALSHEFGAEFITHQGALDRERMRNLVYSDASARKRLEAIVHPLVGQEIACQTDAAVQSGSRLLVFDIPLLVESGRWRQNLHQVLVVDCTAQRQIERVMARSNLARADVEAIMRSQAPREVRLHGSDLVIFNDTINLTQLEWEVTQIWRWFGLSSQ